MCIKQEFICWGGLAEEARGRKSTCTKGRFAIWNRAAAKQDFMGITFSLSKLLDQLSFYSIIVEYLYSIVHYLHAGAHMQRDGKRG